MWSFWTKPFSTHHRRVWLTERHHLLAWSLSVACAAAHYKDTVLVTDDAGRELLVDRLGLPFGEVSTALNGLRRADPGWWVLGKLWAYRMQTRPFVHLDSDVFLWRPLPAWLASAPVFGQSPEWFPDDDASWYRPKYVDETVRSVGGWLPDEWRWYTSERRTQAICCGILGGTDTKFLAHYANAAIAMIEHPANQPAWASMGSVVGDNILVEQYLLAAFVEYHRHHERRQFQPLVAQYLFESSDAAFDESVAARVGYTHLIGGAKNHPTIMRRLERRVRRDHPDLYERAAAIVAGR